VAIPFNKPADAIIALCPLNLIANAKLRIEVGVEVFVLGYSFKIEPPGYNKRSSSFAVGGNRAIRPSRNGVK
jgi:hypothetical protein